jgi:hypothetical protein
MKMTPRIQRLFLVLVLLAPVVAFFALQSIIGTTRSGSVEELWFVRVGGSPRLVARDRIAVGSQRSFRWQHRLTLLDLTTGERLARRKVDAPLELVGETPEALWFRQRNGSDLQARSPKTLERFEPRTAPPPVAGRHSSPDPAAPAATLADGTRIAAPSADSFLLADATTGEAIAWSDPPSALAVSHTAERLLLSRVESDGRALWRAPLERQRAIRAAARVGEVVVVITSGVARDFAVALDARTGETKWVHHF